MVCNLCKNHFIKRSFCIFLFLFYYIFLEGDGKKKKERKRIKETSILSCHCHIVICEKNFSFIWFFHERKLKSDENRKSFNIVFYVGFIVQLNLFFFLFYLFTNNKKIYPGKYTQETGRFLSI